MMPNTFYSRDISVDSNDISVSESAIRCCAVDRRELATQYHGSCGPRQSTFCNHSSVVNDSVYSLNCYRGPRLLVCVIRFELYEEICNIHADFNPLK